jgi:hypothetical protein
MTLSPSGKYLVLSMGNNNLKYIEMSTRKLLNEGLPVLELRENQSSGLLKLLPLGSRKAMLSNGLGCLQVVENSRLTNSRTFLNHYEEHLAPRPGSQPPVCESTMFCTNFTDINLCQTPFLMTLEDRRSPYLQATKVPASDSKYIRFYAYEDGKFSLYSSEIDPHRRKIVAMCGRGQEGSQPSSFFSLDVEGGLYHWRIVERGHQFSWRPTPACKLAHSEAAKSIAVDEQETRLIIAYENSIQILSLPDYKEIRLIPNVQAQSVSFFPSEMGVDGFLMCAVSENLRRIVGYQLDEGYIFTSNTTTNACYPKTLSMVKVKGKWVFPMCHSTDDGFHAGVFEYNPKSKGCSEFEGPVSKVFSQKYGGTFAGTCLVSNGESADLLVLDRNINLFCNPEVI